MTTVGGDFKKMDSSVMFVIHVNVSMEENGGDSWREEVKESGREKSIPYETLLLLRSLLS